MTGLYTKYGHGPWSADDTNDILADGVYQQSVLVAHQTVDGLGPERRSSGIGDDDDVYMRRVVRADDPHGITLAGSRP